MIKSLLLLLIFSKINADEENLTIKVNGKTYCHGRSHGNIKIQLITKHWTGFHFREPSIREAKYQENGLPKNTTFANATGDFELVSTFELLRNEKPAILIFHDCETSDDIYPGCQRASQFRIHPMFLNNEYRMNYIALEQFGFMEWVKCGDSTSWSSA